MIARLTAEDRQRLAEQLDNLQIELGYLRQVAASIVERVHVVGGQLDAVNDMLEMHGGSRAPADD